MDFAKLQKAYDQANQEFRIRQSKIGCIIALVLVPAGVTLDYFVYPHLLGTIFYIRILCDVFLLGVLALHYIPHWQKYQNYLIFIWPAIIDIAICLMIYLSEGVDSPYYAGLNLVIICVTFLLPLTFLESVAISSITIFIYIIAIAIHGNSFETDGDLLFNNLYFLTLTGIISCVANYFNTQRRFSEFRLQYELDIRNQELAELDRLKSQFFANVSHELRTPLTLILTPVQDLLQSQSLNKKTADALQLVKQNALRLLKLVNDLLDVIQLEVGKKRLKMQAVDLHSVLNSTIESMRYLAKSKQINLQVELVATPVMISADVSALEKIIINLVNNAIKFTENGGNITVSSELVQNQVLIRVKDTGIGIAVDDLPHIFKRFHQADGSTTRKYQGTGLGLALVKELVEQHNGRITAESDLGKGTSLLVYLPLLEVAEQDNLDIAGTDESLADDDAINRIHQAADRHIAAEVDSTTIATEIVDETQPKPTLLIVDDEPDILHYLTELLKDEYEVLQAVNGKQAVSVATEAQPDLMLLDFMLPQLSGLQVCQQLKQQFNTNSNNDNAKPGTKIILLTARVDETTKLDALKSGADDFLTKPFSSVEIKTRLQNLLKTAKLEQQLRNHNIELQSTLQQLKETESQLVHSEKLNALGYMSAGLLHEINNPLNYVLAASQIIQMDETVQKDEDLMDSCNDITEGLDRIRIIVSDLRAFAYPEKANVHTSFAFGDAVETALRFVSHDMHGIEFEKELDEAVLVTGSQTNIVQVLVNLLTNASKALEGIDAPVIRIASRIENNRLHVLFTDNGIGISEENEAKIFSPFFTTREIGEGMGLGLSICYTIIKNHGGTLAIDKSIPDRTGFSFDLPLQGDTVELNYQEDDRDRNE